MQDLFNVENNIIVTVWTTGMCAWLYSTSYGYACMVNTTVNVLWSGWEVGCKWYVNNIHFLQFEKRDYRVFFINAFSNIGRKILCEVIIESFNFILGKKPFYAQAYLKGLTYPKYVWLTYGWYQDRWWTEEVNPEPINCTDHQLAEVLHRSFLLPYFYFYNAYEVDLPYFLD